MIKWFAYIVLLLIITPALLSAKDNDPKHALYKGHDLHVPSILQALSDTIATIKNAKHPQEPDDKKKIKEIGKAKRQPKPEKVTDEDARKTKSKRVRRPEGMERPPEIPRRSGD